MMKLETETEVKSKNTPAITDYARGATKDNAMRIFEIITLKLTVLFSITFGNLNCYQVGYFKLTITAIYPLL